MGAALRSSPPSPERAHSVRPLPGSDRARDRAHPQGLQRGRYDEAQVQSARELLHAAPTLADLAPCDLVIEAAPEQLAVKHELSRRSARLSPPLRARDEHLVDRRDSDRRGRHTPPAGRGNALFQPRAVMKLVEIIAGLESGEDALSLARETAIAMKRTPIDAEDATGFSRQSLQPPIPAGGAARGQ